MEILRELQPVLAKVTGVRAFGNNPGSFGQRARDKPIEFVVHVNPGGGTDVFARLIIEILSREKAITQPMVVNTRAGGGGTVAFNYVKS